MFPTLLNVLLTLSSRRAISGRLEKVRQRLIDAEYVVEEKVENYEPEKKAETSEFAMPVMDLADGVGDEGDWENLVDAEGDGEGEGDDSDEMWPEEVDRVHEWRRP